MTDEPLSEVEWKTLFGNLSGEMTYTTSKDYDVQFPNYNQIMKA
jgi:hypothetical protein